MAFLGLPTLTLGTPARTSPTTPGTVAVSISVPLVVERIEICWARACPDAEHDPLYDVTAEVWWSDRTDPLPPFARRDGIQFPWIWSGGVSPFKRITAGMLSGAVPSGDRSKLVLGLTDTRTVAESALNEDWGPFPPPGAPPANKTRDELFLRANLATLFASWNVVQTIDSPIVTGQFFGP